MKIIKKAFLFILLLFLSGCYDYKELNELAIINGIAIEFNDNLYTVTYEIFNTNDDNNKDDVKKSYTIKDSGTSLENAISNINNHLDKKAYFEHIKIMVIDKNVNILDIYDYILRNNSITTNFYLVQTEKPTKLIEYENKDNTSNSSYIYNILKNINYTDITHYFDATINNILYKNIDIAIPYIKVDDDIYFKTYAIYKKNKFSFYLDNDYLDIYRLFTKEDNLIWQSDNTSISFYQKNINYKISNNITIDMKLKAKISTLNTNINLRDNHSFNTLESSYTLLLQENINKFINYLKEEKVDILGINHLKYLKTGKYDDNYFYDNNFSIFLNLKIEKPGLTVTGGKSE